MNSFGEIISPKAVELSKQNQNKNTNANTMAVSKENIITSILESVEEDEIGDCMLSRLEHLCRSSLFSSVRIIKNSDAECPENYSDYRCWTEFFVDQEHTMYEFNKWIGSMLYLQERNRELNISLILKFSNFETDEALEICKAIFPAAEFRANEHEEIAVFVQDLLLLGSL